MNEKVKNLDTNRTLKLVFWMFNLAFLVAALISPDRGDMLSGLKAIYTTPAQVTKDYFEVGSVSAAFMNACLVGVISTLLYYLPGAACNGLSFMAYGLIVGFCFWGMNVVNIIPTFLGCALYCLIKKEQVGKNANLMLFTTGIAPLVTDMMLRYPGLELHFYTPASVIWGLFIGMIIGFLTPMFCAYMPNCHKGFSLYNAALALGIMSFFMRAFLYTFLGGELPPIEAVLGPSRPVVFYTFFGVTFGLCIVLGLWMNGWSFKGYGSLLKASGYKTDYSKEFNNGLAVMNIGIYGLFLCLYYTVVRGSLNGVTFGLILCMVSCAVAGSHPGNAWPIMAGYIVASFLSAALFQGEAFKNAINAQAILVGMCYAQGLSPISGKYGWQYGIIAGMLHYMLVTCVPALHGGFLLYNGGFTAGLVCIFFVPVLEKLAKTKEERKALKKA